MRHSSSGDSLASEEKRSAFLRPIRIPLVGTLRNIVNEVQLTREERLELDELQRALGTKSRRETLAISRQFIDIMENGRDYDDLF